MIRKKITLFCSHFLSFSSRRNFTFNIAFVLQKITKNSEANIIFKVHVKVYAFVQSKNSARMKKWLLKDAKALKISD